MTPNHSPADAPAPRLVSRSAFLRIGAVAAAGVAFPATWAGAARAVSGQPADQVRIDLGKAIGSPTYAATGFLHGLNQDGTQPPDELLRPLKPQLFRGGGSTLPGGGWGSGGYEGYAVRWQNVLDRFNRVAPGPLHAEYCIVMSDLWGANGVDLEPTDPYPGDDGDWSNYEQFVTQMVADAQAAGMAPDQIQYEIWNEPDYGDVYWPRPHARYVEMWQRGVRLIRQLDPQARIVGPTFTRIVGTSAPWHMADWLDMAVASDTVPDILAWHDLIPGRDPVMQADLARELLAARGLDHVQLEINEYPSSSGLDPGFNAWYVSRFQRARIDYGVLAIFGPCCMFPLLDGLLTQEGDELHRNGRWWVYERYASVDGELVATRPGTLVDAVAGIDRRRGQARIVLGNNRGDGSDLGVIRVSFDGLIRTRQSLVQRGRIPVRLERIADRSKLDRVEVVRDLEIAPDATRLDVDIPWYDAHSSYVITLGQQDFELPPYVIVEAEPAALVLLPDFPADVTFRLRNYSDQAITLHPEVTASAGYTVEHASEVSVPANDDALVVVTVTRPASVQTAGELTLSLGDQTLTVPLAASDNWARVAEMSASSTHAPSSPDNLNDGLTDPERWGGGGAGGWNDDTVRTFPDWVTAAWDRPVPLARARVHTLDSAAYPASAWGVRDYDLRVRVGGSWRTVAQVRGNTAGVIESRFEGVVADRLEVVIFASNSGDYSRLIEVEAFSS